MVDGRLQLEASCLKSQREPTGPGEQVDDRAGFECGRKLVREQRRDGVANLHEPVAPLSKEAIGIGEALESCRLTNRDEARCGRMDVAAIAGAVEVGRDRVARIVEAQPPIVGATAPSPVGGAPPDLRYALRGEILGQTPPISAGWHTFYDPTVERAQSPSDVIVNHDDRVAARIRDANPRLSDSFSTRFSSGTSWRAMFKLRFSHARSSWCPWPTRTTKPILESWPLETVGTTAST